MDVEEPILFMTYYIHLFSVFYSFDCQSEMDWSSIASSMKAQVWRFELCEPIYHIFKNGEKSYNNLFGTKDLQCPNYYTIKKINELNELNIQYNVLRHKKIILPY